MLRPIIIRWHALDLGDPDFDPGRSPIHCADAASKPRSQREGSSRRAGQSHPAPPVRRLLCAGLFGETLDQRTRANAGREGLSLARPRADEHGAELAAIHYQRWLG